MTKNKKGASLIEYSLLVGLISVAAITAVGSMGREVSSIFRASSEAIDLSEANAETEDGAEDVSLEAELSFGDNLLTNGDASDGLSGWVFETGSMTVETEDGNPFYRVGDGLDSSYIVQDYQIPEALWAAIDEERVLMTQSFRARSFEANYAPSILTYASEFEGREGPAGRLSHGTRNEPVGEWVEHSRDTMLGPNARWLQTRLGKWRGSSGGTSAVDFDDISIVLIELPAP